MLVLCFISSEPRNMTVLSWFHKSSFYTRSTNWFYPNDPGRTSSARATTTMTMRALASMSAGKLPNCRVAEAPAEPPSQARAERPNRGAASSSSPRLHSRGIGPQRSARRPAGRHATSSWAFPSPRAPQPRRHGSAARPLVPKRMVTWQWHQSKRSTRNEREEWRAYFW